MFSAAKRQDARAIRKVLHGSREAFAELVDRYLPAVNAVAYAHLGRAADVEDVAQEAFLQAYRSLDSLREARKFEGWLITITRNKCYELLRGRQRDTMLREAVGVQPAEPVVTDAAREEIRRIVYSRVQALDAQHREVLLLHYFAGKSTREAGVALGIGRDAVKKRLERARAALGRELVDDLGGLFADDKSREECKGAILAAVAGAQTPWLDAAPAVPALFAFKASTVYLMLALGMLGAVAYWVAASTQEDEPLPAGASNAAWDTMAAINEAIAEADADWQSLPQPQPAGSSLESAAIRSSARPTREAAPFVESTEGNELDGALRQRMYIEFENEHISRILQFFHKYSDLDIVVDYAAVAPPADSDGLGNQLSQHGAVLARKPVSYSTDGMVENIKVSEVSVMQALETLLYPLGLDFVLEPGYLWVSSPDLIRQEVKACAPERYDAYGLEKTLDSPITIEFQGEHVWAVLDFLSEYVKINIVLDQRAVAPRPSASAADGYAPLYNYASDGMVRYIGLKGVELRDALTALLRPLNLDYSVKHGMVWVSSPQRLKGGLFVPHTVMEATAPNPAGILDEKDTVLLNVLDRLSKYTGETFCIEDRTFVTPYIPWGSSVPVSQAPVVEQQLQRVTLDQALAALLWPQGLDYTYYDGRYWIGTVNTISHREINTRSFKPLAELTAASHVVPE